MIRKKKLILSIFLFAVMVYGCIMMNASLTVNAGTGFADMIDDAMTYFNHECDADGKGIYPGDVPHSGEYLVGNLLGFQDYQKKGACFVYCQQSAKNVVAYNAKSVSKVKFQNTAYVRSTINVGVMTSGLSTTPANFETLGDGTGGITEDFDKYLKFGYALNALGYDETDFGGTNSVRAVSGTILMAVYALTSSTAAAMEYVVEALKTLNPFLIFGAGAAGTSGGGGSGGMSTVMSAIQSVVGGYYSAFRNFGFYITVPIFLAIGLYSFIVRHDGAKSAFWASFRGWLIRLAFIMVGIPTLFSLYDMVLNEVSDAAAEADGTQIVLSILFDFESWINDENGVDTMGISSAINGDMDLNEEVVVNVRTKCAESNGVTIGSGGGAGASTYVSIEESLYQTLSGGGDSNKATNLIRKYADGDQVDAASVYDGVTVGDNYIHSWEDFDPFLAVSNKANLTQADHEGHHSNQAEYVFEVASTRFQSAPWATSDGGFSSVAKYNFLNSRFSEDTIYVYNPRTSDSDHSILRHYSVNLVGTPIFRFLYFVDAIVLMGATMILVYAFAFGMLLSNFKAMFQLLPAALSGLMGSLRGIASSIILMGAASLNVIVTLVMYDVASRIMNVLYSGIEMGFANMISSHVSLGAELMSACIIVFSMVLALTVVKKLMTWRKAVIQSGTEVFTATVNKLLGTQVSAPNIQPKSSALTAGLGLAAGVGMAAASGQLDGVGERLGLGGGSDSSQSLASRIGESFGLDTGETKNGVVGAGASASDDSNSSSPPSDTTGFFKTNADGSIYKDGDGNFEEMSASDADKDNVGEFYTDENGDPITDGNGFGVSAEDGQNADTAAEEYAEQNEQGFMEDTDEATTDGVDTETPDDVTGADMNEDSSSSLEGDAAGSGAERPDTSSDSYSGAMDVPEDAVIGNLSDSGGFTTTAFGDEISAGTEGNAIMLADGSIIKGSMGSDGKFHPESSGGNTTSMSSATEVSANSDGITVNNEDGTSTTISSNDMSDSLENADGEAITDADGNELQYNSSADELAGESIDDLEDEGWNYVTGTDVNGNSFSGMVNADGDFVSGAIGKDANGNEVFTPGRIVAGADGQPQLQSGVYTDKGFVGGTFNTDSDGNVSFTQNADLDTTAATPDFGKHEGTSGQQTNSGGYDATDSTLTGDTGYSYDSAVDSVVGTTPEQGGYQMVSGIDSTTGKQVSGALVTDSDGNSTFVSGRIGDDGTFESGRYDSNGDFEDGLYTNKGFVQTKDAVSDNMSNGAVSISQSDIANVDSSDKAPSYNGSTPNETKEVGSNFSKSFNDASGRGLYTTDNAGSGSPPSQVHYDAGAAAYATGDASIDSYVTDSHGNVTGAVMSYQKTDADGNPVFEQKATSEGQVSVPVMEQSYVRGGFDENGDFALGSVDQNGKLTRGLDTDKGFISGASLITSTNDRGQKVVSGVNNTGSGGFADRLDRSDRAGSAMMITKSGGQTTNNGGGGSTGGVTNTGYTANGSNITGGTVSTGSSYGGTVYSNANITNMGNGTTSGGDTRSNNGYGNNGSYDFSNSPVSSNTHTSNPSNSGSGNTTDYSSGNTTNYSSGNTINYSSGNDMFADTSNHNGASSVAQQPTVTNAAQSIITNTAIATSLINAIKDENPQTAMQAIYLAKNSGITLNPDVQMYLNRATEIAKSGTPTPKPITNDVVRKSGANYGSGGRGRANQRGSTQYRNVKQ